MNICGVTFVPSRRNNVPGRLYLCLFFNLGLTYDREICNSLWEREKKHLYLIISNKLLQWPRGKKHCAGIFCQ